MEAFTCANSVTGDFGFKSFINSRCFSSEPLCVGCQQFAYRNANDTPNIMLLEDVDIHEDTGRSENENSEVAELEVAFNEVVCVQDVNGRLSGHNQSNPADELSGSSGAKMQKGLKKFATFPVSENVHSSEDIPSTPQKSQIFLESENLAYTRSLSLPTTLKLVSAMKGGREAQGKPVNSNLSVKWAPDVYDPPESTMSHTVKNHHHRPKPKKKDQHKHKHKGKSSRGCGSEKKHLTRRNTSNTSDHLPMRLQAPSDRIPLDGFAHSNAEVLDYAASGQDKCGSSYFMESIVKVVNC